MFKQLKNMRGMRQGAPERTRNAKATGAPAEHTAAQTAPVSGASAEGGSFAADPAGLSAIGGVTLDQYVEISKDIAAAGSSGEASAASAAAKGISAENWAAAVAGWNRRIKSNGGIAHQFNRLYVG